MPIPPRIWLLQPPRYVPVFPQTGRSSKRSSRAGFPTWFTRKFCFFFRLHLLTVPIQQRTTAQHASFTQNHQGPRLASHPTTTATPMADPTAAPMAAPTAVPTATLPPNPTVRMLTFALFSALAISMPQEDVLLALRTIGFVCPPNQ
jgi:hypothetical protein